MTGTTHGSIIEINGQWYVFYHRLTHKSDYSRQACAEKITVAPDGSIKQAEITSCGLNDGALKAKGSYPAVIACNITNGRMPHGSNRIYTDSFPNVNDSEGERFIDEISDGTMIGFKYFEFSGAKSISVTYRGNGSGVLKIHTDTEKSAAAEVNILPCEKWNTVKAEISLSGVYPVYLIFHGEGNISLKDICFE